MDIMEKLDKDDIKELFSKNWLTHDAMWYGNIRITAAAEL